MRFLPILLFFSLPLQAQVTFQNAFDNLSFSSPMDFQFVPQIPDTVFVAERAGTIRKFKNAKSTTSSSIILNIQSLVSTSGEGGLLGFAFHPNYINNGLLYLHYTRESPFRSVISQVDMNIGISSEVILIELNQPFNNHNGGQIRFGPDEYLYIALGDGGSGGDPLGHGQNRSTLLGNILRIDVNTTSSGNNYGIPADNPFIGNSSGWREEIYAYGFRNPFRFSFDRETGDLWVADVGQNQREEVNIVEKGKNYGWNTMEGSLCFNPSSGCNQSGLELPVYEYGFPGSQSITGGFVYRGEQNPDLHGRYFFGDFMTGDLWNFYWDGESVSGFTDIGNLGNTRLVCFGEDHDGELYMCSFEGRIYKIDVGKSVSVESDGISHEQPSLLTLQPNYPNPFNPATKIRYILMDSPGFESGIPVRLAVYDLLGREVAVLADGTQPAGQYEVTFNAASLPSGIYMYRLSAYHYFESRKMLLIK